METLIRPVQPPPPSGSSIYYVHAGEGVKTPYAFPISVMFKGVYGGGVRLGLNVRTY